MSVIPSTYNFLDHYKGSTLEATAIKFNFDITGATILCQIKKNEQDIVVFHTWKTGVNITVTDNLTGSISLDKINKFSIPKGKYIYDLQIDFADGTSETYLKGSINIIQDTSRL